MDLSREDAKSNLLAWNSTEMKKEISEDMQEARQGRSSLFGSSGRQSRFPNQELGPKKQKGVCSSLFPSKPKKRRVEGSSHHRESPKGELEIFTISVQSHMWDCIWTRLRTEILESYFQHTFAGFSALEIRQ